MVLLMENRPSSNQERRECALRFFAQLAARGAGYELRGVRDWAHADDVQQRLRGHRWSELLSVLAEARQLDRECVSPPEAKSPSYVYRIAEWGLEAVRALVSAELPPIPPAGPPDTALRVYVRRGGRWALEVLREAYRVGGKPHRMNGEPGWLTSMEIRKPLEAWNRLHGSEEGFRIILDTDTLSLISSGLIEKAHVQLAWGREKPVVMYRVTPLGRTVKLLEWYEPEPGAADFVAER
jgi:hypothetical protein